MIELLELEEEKNMRSFLLLVAVSLTSVSALAQDAFPSRPITMIVAFPPGGVADITARPTAFARFVKSAC